MDRQRSKITYTTFQGKTIKFKIAVQSQETAGMGFEANLGVVLVRGKEQRSLCRRTAELAEFIRAN